MDFDKGETVQGGLVKALSLQDNISQILNL